MHNKLSFFDTEYKRLQFFEKSTNFIKPDEHVIGTVSEESRKENRVSLNLKNRVCSYLPIKKQLQVFLEIPGVLASILDYQKTLENGDTSNGIQNIIQGSLWKSLKLEKKAVIPILLYFDDFEVGNPLGSHAGCYKLGALYYTIATIPPEFSSRLENIFIACLFHSSDRSYFGNKTVLNPLIKEFSDLEINGIYIQETKEHVYFAVSLVLGDNLGIHSLLGLTESFSSNYFCRFCIGDKQILRTLTREDASLIREKSNYSNHVKDKSFGVKEECIFNNLNYFHIYENLSIDIMHDLYKGFCTMI